MKLTVVTTFVLVVLTCNLALSSAYPPTYSVDRFDEDVGDVKYIDDAYNYRNSRLRRINYENDDDNSVDYPSEFDNTPISRADTDADTDADSDSKVAYKYIPIIRYKAARTQRKKLFVANVWG